MNRHVETAELWMLSPKQEDTIALLDTDAQEPRQAGQLAKKFATEIILL